MSDLCNGVSVVGKRSNFERREADFYPTPRAADPVSSRHPHLAKPCCGDGALVRHLESFGLRCVCAGDITTGQDALALTAADCNDADCDITTPPYIRELMHRLITHLQQILPSIWLLLETDWASTKQAVFRHRLVGRLRWIEGTTMSGKQNFAWYRFDVRHLARLIRQSGLRGWRAWCKALMRRRIRLRSQPHHLQPRTPRPP
jgi:hypothetical protein